MAVLIKVIVLCFEQQGRRRQRYIHLVTVTPVLTSIGIINDVRHSRYFLVFRCMQCPFRHPTRLFFLSSELADGVIILRYLQTFSRSLFTISTNKRTKYFILPLPSQSRSEVSWIGFLTLDKFAHPSTTQENVLFSLLWLDAHLTSFSRISLGRNSRVFAKHKLLCTFLYYILLPSHVFGTAVFVFRIFKLLGVWCWCYKILYTSCRLYFLCSLSKNREIVSETEKNYCIL